jgi:hypothetical protein
MEDEPLIVFITICCFLVITFNFTFFRENAERLLLYLLMGQPCCKCVSVFGSPLKKLLQGISEYCPANLS